MNKPTQRRQIFARQKRDAPTRNERPGQHPRPGALTYTHTRSHKTPHRTITAAPYTPPHPRQTRCTARRRPNRGETHTGKGKLSKTRQRPVQRTRNDSAWQVERNPRRKRQERGERPAVAPAPLACARSRTKHRQHHHARRAQKAVGRVAPGNPKPTRPTRSRARNTQPRALKAR